MTTPKIWEWAESCDPEHVTEDDAWRLFGLLSFPEGCSAEYGKCKKPALCKVSPYCLAAVTPAALFKSIKDSKKELDKLKEINEAQRSDSDYVGLDNLGATCYVNSYLQMWFHTAPFRHLILSYKPVAASENEQGHDDSIESTIHQMRVLFAQMLLTKKRSLLPDAFIETLGLDPNNQQDAQEFSNLWMGLLEHRFGTAFSRLFGGSIDVSIVCDACGRASHKPDPFSELILNVPAAEAMPQSQIIENSPGRRQGGTTVNLEDVMRRYLGDETLDGDNAYECKSCGKKRKAVRHTRLEKAPAILNAQVLRFAFDQVKLQRRKLRTVISFPEHLELRREYFAEDSPELKNPTLPRYRIKAILCHIGTSVFRGHYTARIRLRDGWHIFNDAVVKKGDPTSGGDGGVDADESGTAGGRRFRSADAYCIVYHRVDAPELGEEDDLELDAETLPSDLREEVTEVEERFRSELEKKREDIMATSDAKEQIREQRLRIRRDMAVQLPSREEMPQLNAQQVRKVLNSQKGGGVVFVHKDFINDYLLLKTCEDPTKAFGCGEELRCDHGRLGVGEIGRLKVIPRAAAEMISAELGYQALANSAGKELVTFTSEDMCMTCIRISCFDYYYRARAAELARDVKVELKQIENNVNNADRKYWIVKESAEKFGDMAKEAIIEAERNLKTTIDSVIDKGPVSTDCHNLSITSNSKAKSIESALAMTADQFFGTQTSLLEEKPRPVSTNNNVPDISGTGVREIPPVAVVLKKDNSSATVYMRPVNVRKDPPSSSHLNSQVESPSSSHMMGPTPVKRAKMSSQSDDSDFELPCKIEPTKNNFEQMTDDDSQFAAALQASLNEGVLNSPTTNISSSNHAISPELSQNMVNDYIKSAFNSVDTNINTGALCCHSALWLTASSGGSGRKSRAGVVLGLVRISEPLWERMAAFFPNSLPFCYPDYGACPECEKNATNERAMSDKMREEAKQIGSILGALAKQTKRSKVDTALRPIFLVTADFCNRLNDWITGKTQTLEGDRTISNRSGLCRHGRLTFLPDELADDVNSDKGTWVATKGNEWKYIKETFAIDVEVMLKPVCEKLGKESTSSSGSTSSRSNWIAPNSMQSTAPSTSGAGGSILQNILTSSAPKPNQLPRIPRISPTEEQRRQDAAEFKANDASIVVDSSSDATYEEEEDEILTDEDEDDFVVPATKPGRGRGRGAKAARGRGRGRTGEGAAKAAAKSRRVGWDSMPGVCQTCRQERFDQLALARSFPEPLVWSGPVYVKLESGGVESLTPPPQTTRRRRRVAQMSRKMAAINGEEVDYVVDSTCPFIEFQMSILEDFEISPFEQMLFVFDEDSKVPRQIVTPEDQAATLGQMQIQENQVFILKRKDEDEDEDFAVAAANSVTEVDENSKKAKTNNRAEGFGGTLLSVLANAAPMKRPISPGPSNN